MKKFLDYTLFSVGDFHLKIMSLVILMVFSTCIFILLKLLRKSIYNIHSFDDAKKYSIFSLLKYFIVFLSVFISFQLIGVDISILAAGSAALLVGLGLGIQNLFSDYISGIIILIDSTVKVGDIIEVNEMICKIEEIRLRTTKVLTRDDKNIILPNTELTRNNLINWTLHNRISRFEVVVGVEYSANVPLVLKLTKDATSLIEGISKTPAPFVRLTDFSDSALEITIYFWAEEVFRVENIKSELRIKILELFNQNNVTIPFPQRVIHTK